MASKHNPAVPVLALLLGAAMWGVIWYPLRLLEAAGASGLWVTLLIYAWALAASLMLVPQLLRASGRCPGLLAGLALAAGWTNTAFVLAILDGNVMRVLLLFYLSPLWATLLGWFFLHERISRVSLLTLLLAMSGALLMLWNPRVGIPWPHDGADWLALTAGMAFATSNVLVRKGHDVAIGAKLVATWAGVLGVTLALLVMLRPAAPVWTASLLAGGAAVGIAGILVMTALVQYGVTHMPVHRSAVILLFELVAGAVSQQLLTDEVVTAVEWAGGLLIAAAAYVSARRG